MWLWLPATNLLAQPHRVLHFAPESLVQDKLKALPNLDHLSVDLVSPIADRQADITALPFADASFDIILCNHVLEHVPDDARAMSEVFRVLAPGGWAMLLTPYRADADTDEDPDATPDERVRRFGQDDHVRTYGRDYPDRLRSAGFSVRQQVVRAMFDASVVKYYGLYADEVFFIGDKGR